MKPLYITLAILTLILSIAFLSKPGEDEMQTRSEEIMLSEIGNSGNKFADRLGKRIVEKCVKVEDKTLWRESTFTYAGKSRTVCYGLFGSIIKAKR
jgi:hypothetical protein